MVPEEERGKQILILRRFQVQENLFFLIPGFVSRTDRIRLVTS